jgi:hypothetical protein
VDLRISKRSSPDFLRAIAALTISSITRVTVLPLDFDRGRGPRVSVGQLSRFKPKRVAPGASPEVLQSESEGVNLAVGTYCRDAQAAGATFTRFPASPSQPG